MHDTFDDIWNRISYHSHSAICPWAFVLNHYFPLLTVHDLKENTRGQYITYQMISRHKLLLPMQDGDYLVVDDTLKDVCEHVNFMILLNI